MTMTDPIADLLTRIRNANMAGLEQLRCPSSKMKTRILSILKDEGYIKGFSVDTSGKHDEIVISMKYQEDRSPVILGIQRVSRPGLRRYVRHDTIPRVRNGMGTAILSTSRGLMTDVDARKQRIGGELICTVW